MKNKQTEEMYESIEELIRDVNGLGDWRDPSQLEDFAKVWSKISSIGKPCVVDGVLTYYNIEVGVAVHQVLGTKFPDISIKERVDMSESEIAAVKEVRAFYKKLNCVKQESLPTFYSTRDTTDKDKFKAFTESCIKYLSQSEPHEVIL